MGQTMLRQILRPTESRLVLELPAEFIGQEIEVLAFPVEDAPKPPADAAQSTDLLSFASRLREGLGQPAETPNWPPEIMAFEGMPDMPAFESHRQAFTPPPEDPFA